jgi:hypothetical protein
MTVSEANVYKAALIRQLNLIASKLVIDSTKK